MNVDPNAFKILTGDINTRDFSALSQDYTVIFTGIDNVIVSKNIGVANSYTVRTSLSDHDPVFADLLIGE